MALHKLEEETTSNLSGLEGDISPVDTIIIRMFEEKKRVNEEKKLKDDDKEKLEQNESTILLRNLASEAKTKRSFKNLVGESSSATGGGPAAAAPATPSNNQGVINITDDNATPSGGSSK